MGYPKSIQHCMYVHLLVKVNLFLSVISMLCYAYMHILNLLKSNQIKSTPDNCRSTRFRGWRYIGFKNCLSEEATKSIVHALVKIIDYYNGILVNLLDFTIEKLQKLMNAAACIVTRTPCHRKITPVLKRLHWLPVRQSINFKVLSLTYKALNNEASVYLRKLLVDYQPTRALRSSAARLLVVPRRKLKYGERAFSFAAPTLWNQLLNHIKLSESTVTLKKTWISYFSEYYKYFNDIVHLVAMPDKRVTWTHR